MLNDRLDPFTQMRLRRGAEHLHRLGARATAEYIVELGRRIGGMPAATLAKSGRRYRYVNDVDADTAAISLPPDLRQLVAAALGDDPSIPWDLAVAGIAAGLTLRGAP